MAQRCAGARPGRHQRGLQRSHDLPPTSIVGAILWTGYLGDLVVTHLKFF